MTLKDRVLDRGKRLAGHPAVAALTQDPRFMKLVMAALAVPGRLTELSAEQKANLLRLLGAASQHEVDDLKRAVRALEDELSRLRR